MEKWKSGDSTSLLSRNIKIEGEIRGDENLHIEGRFKGSIKLTGNVFIGTTGVVEADVEAGNIVIQGNVTGNVTARQQLEIQPTGKLMGDCRRPGIFAGCGRHQRRQKVIWLKISSCFSATTRVLPWSKIRRRCERERTRGRASIMPLSNPRTGTTTGL